MDKNLAMALLAFDRPGAAGELPPADRAALAALVAADPALADYARRRAAEDGALSTAMAAVTVPAGAKARALNQLLVRRSATLWRQRLTAAGLAAAQSSLCTTTVLTDPRSPGVRWVLVHTSPTLDAFLKPDTAL